jgi:hypothetical protein
VCVGHRQLCPLCCFTCVPANKTDDLLIPFSLCRRPDPNERPSVRPVPTWSSSVSPTCRLIRSDVGSSRNGSLPSLSLPCICKPSQQHLTPLLPSPHHLQLCAFGKNGAPTRIPSRSSAPVESAPARHASQPLMGGGREKKKRKSSQGEKLYQQPTQKNAQPIGHL